MNNGKILSIFVLIIIFLGLSFPSHGDDDILVHWFEKVASGVYDVNEPILPITPLLENEVCQYAHEINKKQTSLGFANFISASSILEHKYDNYQSKSKKRLPEKMVKAILNRRLPIINNYPYDKTKYKNTGSLNPKYHCFATLNSQWDYLGMVQLTLMYYIIYENDLRFEREAIDFLNYFYAPIPDCLDKTKMKDKDARLCYSLVQGPAFRLPPIMGKYINLCRATRNESLIDPQKSLKEYFGKDCRYYDVENWRDYVKKSQTEADRKRMFDACEKSREKSKERYRKNAEVIRLRLLNNIRETK